MIVKKYIVDNMKEAIIRAKYELGKEAVIISHRIIKVGKWYKPFKKEKLEVTVALEENTYYNKRVLNNIGSIEEVDPLKQAIGKDEIYKNVSKETQEQLLKYCKMKAKDNYHLSPEEMKAFIESSFKANCFAEKVDLSRVNVLIGPTGVGKTTTIAKIAAKEFLINKKKVGLITMDTYRIGAVEQLKTYASILGLPCEIVTEPGEMENKINKLSYCDIVLIDTLGASQKNKEKLDDIEQYLNNIREKLNVYLVLSISTDRETTISILEKYKQFNYDAIILTKFDEVDSFSNIWNIIENNSYPIQYICYGQDVPDDIQEATLENLLGYYEVEY
ncbi:hypothetical protein GC105_03265 [Alkalibaculum sp. M08DMB]|uniref:Flagellar biosynthesis protein FlhF n=1 Tax=Alkalibaculum sporogenes TaxID=2655001 RepID=A0A6A7K5W5_9FIRM|nr:hypothetical protein [Alkalibaculum sporogenes]MPW24810.1 hypothetical protein [Alkalibaculum sporogenes]